MSLSDLASLGSFVSGVAVLATLVLLLLQMRQSNLNQRALMQQMRSARTIETLLKQAEPDIANAGRSVFLGEGDIDPGQLRSFVMIQVAVLTNFEDTFLQR